MFYGEMGDNMAWEWESKIDLVAWDMWKLAIITEENEKGCYLKQVTLKFWEPHISKWYISLSFFTFLISFKDLRNSLIRILKISLLLSHINENSISIDICISYDIFDIRYFISIKKKIVFWDP